MGNGTIRKPAANKPNVVEVGYIVIPKQENGSVSRNDYISFCLRSHLVCVMTESYVFLNNVFIDNDKLQEIQFPETDQEFGSRVVMVTEPISGKVIIIGIIAKPNTSEYFNQNQFKIQRKYGNNVVEILGDGNGGNLSINVNSDDEGEGNLYISVNNKQNNAKFNLFVNGDINLSTKNNIDINVLNELILKCINEDSQQETKISIKDQEVKLNLGTYAVPLGDLLQTELNKMKARIDLLYNAINNGVPAAGDGGAALQTSMKVIIAPAVSEDYSQILSQIFKIE